MVKKKFTASLIGAGRIGFTLGFDKKREKPASHSFALRNDKRIKIVSACDINRRNLKLWKKYFKDSKIYDNQKDFFKNESTDIVVVAVNENAHLSTAIKAIKNKPKLIILEKPVAPNLKEAFLIRKYSKKYGVSICINHERRYSLDYQSVEKAIKLKRLGEIESVVANFWSGAKVYKKDAEKYGDCSLIHDGTHLFDILNFLFGIKFIKPRIDKIDIDDKKNVSFLSLSYVEKIAEYKNDTHFIVEISGNKKVFGFELDIRGTEGRIVIGNGYLDYYERKESPFYKGFYSFIKSDKIKRPKKTKYFSNMVDNCVNFLLDRGKLISDLSSGIRTLKIIFKIIDKIKKNFDI